MPAAASESTCTERLECLKAFFKMTTNNKCLSLDLPLTPHSLLTHWRSLYNYMLRGEGERKEGGGRERECFRSLPVLGMSNAL